MGSMTRQRTSEKHKYVVGLIPDMHGKSVTLQGGLAQKVRPFFCLLISTFSKNAPVTLSLSADTDAYLWFVSVTVQRYCGLLKIPNPNCFSALLLLCNNSILQDERDYWQFPGVGGARVRTGFCYLWRLSAPALTLQQKCRWSFIIEDVLSFIIRALTLRVH